jgi:FkbM family methyltransferase
MNSQYGEDDIFVPLLGDKPGRILDFGAYHPKDKSNSRTLIEKGWEAVLIDVSPYAMQSLLEEYGENPKVTLMNAAVAPQKCGLMRIRMTADGVSSNDPAVIQVWEKVGGYRGWVYVPTIGIQDIWDQFGQFDCVSIDVEGSSAEIAIEWLKMGGRSKVMIVEHDNRIVEIMQVAQECGYKCVFANGTNIILSL